MTGSPTDDPRPTRTPESADERSTTERAPTGHPVAESGVPSAEAAEPSAVNPTPTVPAVSGQPEPVSEPEPEREPGVRVADVVDRRTVRQAPRFGRFILAGVALGAVFAFLLAFLTPPSQYAWSDLFWILFLGLGFFFGIVAAGLAVVLDRRSLARREARTAPRHTPPAA